MHVGTQKSLKKTSNGRLLFMELGEKNSLILSSPVTARALQALVNV